MAGCASFGVDTPERGERCYSQAASALRQLAGRTVRVEHGPRSVDPGGRLLFYVFTEGGNSIDEILVEQGLAPSLEQGTASTATGWPPWSEKPGGTASDACGKEKETAGGDARLKHRRPLC